MIQHLQNKPQSFQAFPFKSIVFLASLLLTLKTSAQFIAPASQDTSNFGKNIQRTMHLLATSTPTKRNTVKILVYGQSISKQQWWLDVKKNLLAKYPHADLIIENKSIGGFSSVDLRKPMVFDVLPFYPDLVLFHVYGSSVDYEYIISTIRSQTAAEIALQNDHIGAGGWQASDWEEQMSYQRIPEFARKYRCEMMDIRTQWKKYAADNGYAWQDMLSDAIHLNDRGEYLMGALISRYLAYKPKFATDPTGLVKTYEVGKDISFVNGVLTLPFDGNKIDIIPSSNGSVNLSADVFIDNQKPSQFPGCYAFSRPNDSTYVPGYYSRDGENRAIRIDWPWGVGSIKTISSNTPITQVEDWEITINSFNADKSSFQFSLKGSITGNDGSGNSGSDFVSNSGKVVIKKADWFITQAMKEAYKITINPGFKIKWTVTPLFKDIYTPQSIGDASKENAVTVAQGFPNGSHTLKLVASGTGTLPIKAIRVYRPYWNRPTTTDVMSELENSITIYPNPTSDYLNLDFSNGSSVVQEVGIINALGNKVVSAKLDGNSTTLQMDLKSIAPGVYIAIIKTNNGSISRKFNIVK